MTVLITLPSPVIGPIHPNWWSRPADNHDFKVTQTAAQHIAGGTVAAIDLGDADPDLDPVYAIITGKVVEHRTSDGVITIESADKWRVVSAHLAIDSIFNSHPLGSMVNAGQQIGRVYNTYPVPNTIARHLHLQLGKNIVSNKGWIDPWPQLAINQWAILNGAGINIRTGPGTNYPIWATSRAGGIYRNGVRVAPLDQRWKVVAEPFAVGSGLVWVHCLYGQQHLYIWKNLVHFVGE